MMPVAAQPLSERDGGRILPTPSPARPLAWRLWRQGRKWIGLGLACIALVWFACEAVTRLPWWPVRDVVVVGARNVDPDEVIDRAQVSVGVPIFGLSADSVIARVRLIPWVLDARVTRRFSGRLEIHVVERTPVGLIWQGRFYLVDASGFVAPLENGRAPDVPVVMGFRLNQPRADAELARLGWVLRTVWELEPLRTAVSEICVSDSTTMVMLLSPKGVPAILPAKPGRDRFVMVASLVARYPDVVRQARYLDVRFAGHVAVGSS